MPFQLSKQCLDEPFPLNGTLGNAENAQDLFPGKNQFNIKLYAEGQDSLNSGKIDEWIWQIVSSSS